MSTPLVPILPPISSPGWPTNIPSTTLQRSAHTNEVSGGNGSPGNPLASAALYLYTFLATLVLLVCISLFVIIRSIIQRRRRNRALREAWLRYTNGTIPFREGDLDLIRFVEFRMNQSAVGTRAGNVDLSTVPTVWETHLAQKKSIDSEKTAEGKLISSSWKLHQGSIPYLDLKSNFPSYWAWSSILPLSSTPLPPDEVSASKDVSNSDFPTMPESLPLGGVRRFFGRMLNSTGSASGQVTPSVYDQGRPHAPASESTISTNPNANPINSVDGRASTPSSHNRHRTDTGAEAQLEEGTLHLRVLSGSNSHPHNSTNQPDMDQTPPVAIASMTTERTESTHQSVQQPGQGTVRDAHISPNNNNPTNPHPSRNQNSNQSQIHPLYRMRVAVLVCMPTPPAPSPHSWLSKAESKAKAKAVSGSELKDSMDERRLSSFSRSTVSTLGGGEQRDDTDTDGVHVPPLEVGLADVDVFPEC